MSSKEDKVILKHLYAFDNFMNEFYHQTCDSNRSSIREISAAYYHHCTTNKIDMGIDGIMGPEYLVYKLIKNQCYPHWGYAIYAKDPIKFD